MKKFALTMAGRLERSAEATAERHPQLNPGVNSTKESTVLRHCEPACRRGNPPAIEPVSHLKAGLSTTFKNDINLRCGLTGSPRANALAMTKNIAFTMAEILLSLTIIGVVAAITLPSLTGNINERTWNTQRKALYARMSQAIALMPALNGYGTLTEESSSGAGDAVDTAAETFVTNGLAKVMKINNICDSEHLEDCGISSSITPLSGGSAIDVPTKISELNSLMTSVATWTDVNGVVHSAESMIDTNAAAFETQNGESIVVYYKPDCTGSLGESNFHYTQNKICANFIYDLNGSKGPNTVGKDIGVITALYPSDSIVVAPFPLTRAASTSISYTASSKECTKIDNESRLPNLEELISMFVNAKLFAMPTGIYWSSSLTTSSGATQAWAIDFNQGRPGKYNKTSSCRLWCVKR